MLQEQLGGPLGELKAALQYLSQSLRIDNPDLNNPQAPSFKDPEKNCNEIIGYIV